MPSISLTAKDRLRRSQSARSMRRSRQSSLPSELFDPSIARQHAAVAATRAMLRSSDRSSADSKHSYDCLGGPENMAVPAPSSPDAEATAPKMPPSSIHPLPPAASSSSSIPRRHGPTLPPSTLTLTRWAYLNQIEREAKERGGTGAKLNFEEFSRRMAADRGRRLAFVASWIEMASF